MQVFVSRAALAATLLMAGAAHAAAIDTHAFTLGSVPFDSFADIALISDDTGAARFSLDGLARGLQSSIDSTGEPWANADSPWQNFYDITVKDGYRVTGITVTGTFNGRLAPVAGGRADNDIGLAFLAWPPGNAPVWSTSARATGLNGQQSWTIGTGTTALDGNFLLSFLGSASTYAASIPEQGDWLGSAASVGAQDLVLTVNVAPVPEPQTWLMLLVGIVAAGAWRGRVSVPRNAARR